MAGDDGALVAAGVGARTALGSDRLVQIAGFGVDPEVKSAKTPLLAQKTREKWGTLKSMIYAHELRMLPGW